MIKRNGSWVIILGELSYRRYEETLVYEVQEYRKSKVSVSA